MRRPFICAVFLCFFMPLLASAQPPQEVLIIFKDGFHFKAIVRQDKDFFIDPVSKQPIEVAKYSGFLYFEDPVRRIYFSPAQVSKPMVLKPGEMGIPDMIRIERNGFGTRTYVIRPGYSMDNDFSPWNENWERTSKMTTNTGARVNLVQRVVHLDPIFARLEAKEYNWDSFYFTKEFGVDNLRFMLVKYMDVRKEFKGLKNYQKRHYLVRFLVQCGYHDEAEKEMETLLVESPDQKTAMEPYVQSLKTIKATNAAEAIERGGRIGQHAIAQTKLDAFFKDNWLTLISDKQQTALHDLRAKYEDQSAKIELGQKYAKELLGHMSMASRDAWTGPLEALQKEIDHETVDRLENFLSFGKLFFQASAANKSSGQTAEQVAALGISGLLLGNGSSEPDPISAYKLWLARVFLLDYLTLSSGPERAKKLTAFINDNPQPIDVLARMLKLLPPVKMSDKVEREAKLSIEVPDSRGGAYTLFLPPDYNPHRPYPVLIGLHGGEEKPEDVVARFSEWTTKFGYILAVPHWSKGFQAKYSYTEVEHGLVLDTLRDLRRRFQIDSDRVFLYGFDEGANAAFDIGLGHPDLFAGVIPVGGSPKGFAEKYATNGQNVPFYVVEGAMRANAKPIRDLFLGWVRGHYASLYMEYKGRGFDTFPGETASIFDWMNRKKRFHPDKAVGKVDHEFKTARSWDNHFYWLSTDVINDKNLSAGQGIPTPARMMATVGVGNQADTKTGAKIWTQFNLTTSGLKHIALWLSPSYVDFSKPVSVYLNGSNVHSPRPVTPSVATLLEDFYQNGDRQRLVYARLDFRW